MNKETIRELREMSEYLGVREVDFRKILLLAMQYQMENGKRVNDELLYEIIKDSLDNIDYSNEEILDNIKTLKTVDDSFNRALTNLGYQKVKTMKRY